jgi:uncharacterized membrane protein
MRTAYPRHLLPLGLAAIVLTFSCAARAAKYTIIDPPDATQSFALGINDSGSAVGYFAINLKDQSFVRASDGSYTIFAPSLASGIDNKGWVAGDLLPGHGFIRKPNGHVATFGDDNAYQSFAAAAINAHHTVCGYVTDQQDFQHGFVRTADGVFTVFDPPGAVRTFATGINDSGLVVGGFYDGSRSRGFMRAPDGMIAVFDDPSERDIAPFSINADGVIVGQLGDYGDAKLFIRNAAGKFKTFDIPASDDVDQLDWVGINDKGVIAGSYDHDTGYTASGFVRARDGTITSFDVPDAYYTYVTGLNRQGAIVGFIDGTDGNYHAYLRTP